MKLWVDDDYEKEITRLKMERDNALALIIIGIVFMVIGACEFWFFMEIAKIYR